MEDNFIMTIKLKTQRDIIKDACDLKGITVKEMCNELNLNYQSYRTTISREYLSITKYLLISKYLDIDLNILLDAPFDNPRKQSLKKESN